MSRFDRIDPLFIPLFCDEATCARISAAMDAGAHQPAEIFAEAAEPMSSRAARAFSGMVNTASDGYVVARRVRRTLDIEPDASTIAWADEALDGVRPEVETHFGVPLTAAEGAGFLRYQTGDFYRRHVDSAPNAGPSTRSGPPAEDSGQTAGLGETHSIRLISVVVFLTSVRGGALRLHYEEGAVDITPAPGLLVAFPSTTVHEVLTVTEGTRDVVVTWFH